MMTKKNRFKRYRMNHPFDHKRNHAIFDNAKGLWVRTPKGHLLNFKDASRIVKKLNAEVK